MHLACPVTREPLVLDEGGMSLSTTSGRRYSVVGGVPILLADTEAAAQYVAADGKMAAEYRPEALEEQSSIIQRVKSLMNHDYATAASRRAFARTFEGNGFFLAVGGGPSRAHARHVNLNIGPFPNVDVVGDAHSLPYQSDSDDAIYCEAVLEHLARPTVAVAEMYRVLRPGALIFASTPFLQPYHGYPHHYQGFTLTGHQELFRHAGFTVEEAGVHVGPMYTVVITVHTALRTYVGRIPALLWGVFAALLRPVDLLLNRREDAHVLASTTYLVARKPPT